MRTLILIFFTLTGFAVFSQEISVDTIVFTETLNNAAKSNIPFVIDKSGTKSEIVEKINEQIKDRFMIDSFDPDSVSQFNWSNIDFQYEIESNVLLISFTGDYYGPYMSSAVENLFFDLSNGDLLEENLLKFHNLFSIDGYFSFLKKYWLPECIKEYNEATQCANYEPYCDCYDINFSSSGNDQISFSLIDDCFPHVIQVCSPSYSISIDIKSIKPFLSNFGSCALFQKEYFKMSSIGQLLFYKENYPKIPSYFFIIGSIDDQHPFSMALEFNNKTKKVNGYYFYNKKNIPIKLEGEYDSTSIKITESVNNKKTGRFEFELNGNYIENGLSIGEDKYCSARWFDAKNNEFTIKLKDIKINRQL
jgi:hypothetical protein